MNIVLDRLNPLHVLRNLWLMAVSAQSIPVPCREGSSLWYAQPAMLLPDGSMRRDPEVSPLHTDRSALIGEYARWSTAPLACFNTWSPTSTLAYGEPSEELYRWVDHLGETRYVFITHYQPDEKWHGWAVVISWVMAFALPWVMLILVAVGLYAWVTA